MAITIPIVTEFADKGIVAAQASFATFKTKVGEAEGGMGKLKAGSQVAFDSIKANAGNLALGAGAAIAGFAAKAIGDFQDLALAVDNFSDRTQLTLDQSSRWNAFTGDLGIEADAMIKIFDKLGKGASDQIPAFQELGVEIAFGPNGATDIEETFFRVIDKLNSLEDPADRAKLSAQLLGKGWQDAAEIVNMSSDDMRTALEAVGDAEIIDEEEIQKAKDLREAQDRLGDAFAELSLTLGEALIPALTEATDVIVPLMSALKPLVELLGDGAGANASYAEQASNNNIQMRTGIGLAEKIFGWFGWGKDKTEELTDENYKLLASWILSNDAVKDITGSTEDLTTAFEDVDEALADLKGEVDERTAWRNLQDEFDSVVDAAIEAFTEGTPKAIRDSEQALDDLRVELGEYIVEADNIPTEVKTQFLAEIPTADLDRLNAILDQVGRSRTVSFIPVIEQARESAGTGSGMGSGRAPRLNPTSTGNVNVTVMGSVVTEGDLVNKVRKGLIDAQRNGAQLVYTNS